MWFPAANDDRLGRGREEGGKGYIMSNLTPRGVDDMSRGEVIGVKDERPYLFEHFGTTIPNLGEPKVDSPIKNIPLFTRNGEVVKKSVVQDAEKVLVYDTLKYVEHPPAEAEPLCFELAGPRAKIFFDSS